MSKRANPSPALALNANKRQKINTKTPKILLNFDTALADELILVIFSFLEARELCVAEAVNHAWRRLATDNELWKVLFLRDFGRLRGRKSEIGALERPMKPLPTRETPVRTPNPLVIWKSQYKIASNWRIGRSVSLTSSDMEAELVLDDRPPRVALAGRNAIIITSGGFRKAPQVFIRSPISKLSLISSHSPSALMSISALALNQTTLIDGSTSIAVFYATTGETLHHISLFSIQGGLKGYKEMATMIPQIRRSAVAQCAYHSTIIVFLTKTFQLEIYRVSSLSKTPSLTHVQSLSSFSSFHPSSLTLSCPSPDTHKILLSFAVGVYPSDWSVAISEFQLNEDAMVSGTRTLRTFLTGWDTTIEDPRILLRMEGTKMKAVTAVESDGRFLVTSPKGENYIMVYRLRQKLLTYVRTLAGPIYPIDTFSVADARCVAVSEDGSVWCWDLETSQGVQIADSFTHIISGKTRLLFDDRRILMVTPDYIQTISFDV